MAVICFYANLQFLQVGIFWFESAIFADSNLLDGGSGVSSESAIFAGSAILVGGSFWGGGVAFLQFLQICTRLYSVIYFLLESAIFAGLKQIV